MENNLTDALEYRKPLPGRKIKWKVLIISLVMVAAAAAITAMLLGALSASSPALGYSPQNMIAEKGGEVFLLCGDKALSLGTGVCYMNAPYSESVRGRLKGIISLDGSRLYYMRDFDRVTGEGTLMAVSADAVSPPVQVAEGVCAAAISADGQNALYLTDIDTETGCGTLWIYKDGQSSRAAKPVYFRSFGFSPDGESYYYLRKTGKDYTLRINNRGTELKAAVIDTPEGCEAVIDNDGNSSYTITDENDTTVLYEYLGGESEKISSKPSFFMMLGGMDSYLYAQYRKGISTLYYKKAGSDEVSIYENEGYIYAIDYILPGYEDSSQCMLCFSDSESSSISIMEFSAEDASLTPVAESVDSNYYSVSPERNFLAYRSGGHFLIAYKREGAWQEPIDLCGKDISNFRVNRARDKVYWAEEKSGQLWCYDLASGESGKVAEDADYFVLSGETPYVVTDAGKVFRAGESGGETLLESAYTPLTNQITVNHYSADGSGSFGWYEQGVTLCTAPGGAYAYTRDKGLIFIANGSGEGTPLLDSGASLLCVSPYDLVHLYGSEYFVVNVGIPYEALSQENGDSLKALYEDLLYYKGLISGASPSGYPHALPDKNMETAIEISEYSYIPADVINITEWFYYSFSMIGEWTGSRDDAQLREATLSDIDYAIYYYQKYMGFSGA